MLLLLPVTRSEVRSSQEYLLIRFLPYFRFSVLLMFLLLPVTRSEYAYGPTCDYNYDSVPQVVCPANTSAVASDQVRKSAWVHFRSLDMASILQAICAVNASAVASDQVR